MAKNKHLKKLQDKDTKHIEYHWAFICRNKML